MSIQEIEKKRDLEYTLDDKHKRNLEKLSRPMFGKDDIKMTYIPQTKVIHHILMAFSEYRTHYKI
jgi:hypothetical protein